MFMVNALRIFFSMKEMKEMKEMKDVKDVQKKMHFRAEARRRGGKEESGYKWQGSFIIHFMFLRGGGVMLEGLPPNREVFRFRPEVREIGVSV